MSEETRYNIPIRFPSNDEHPCPVDILVHLDYPTEPFPIAYRKDGTVYIHIEPKESS